MTACITAVMIMTAVIVTAPAKHHVRSLIPETDAAEDITGITDIVTPRKNFNRRGVLVCEKKAEKILTVTLDRTFGEYYN